MLGSFYRIQLWALYWLKHPRSPFVVAFVLLALVVLVLSGCGSCALYDDNAVKQAAECVKHPKCTLNKQELAMLQNCGREITVGGRKGTFNE